MPINPIEVASEEQRKYLCAWQKKCHAAGLVGSDYPTECGGHGHKGFQTIASQEMARANVPFMINVIGLGMAAPASWTGCSRRARVVARARGPPETEPGKDAPYAGGASWGHCTARCNASMSRRIPSAAARSASFTARGIVCAFRDLRVRRNWTTLLIAGRSSFRVRRLLA